MSFKSKGEFLDRLFENIKSYIKQNKYTTVIYILLFSLILPFFIQGPDNIARYAAGGQVFGALATLLAVFIALYQFGEQNKINSIIEFNKSRSYLLPTQGGRDLDFSLGEEKQYDPDEEIHFVPNYPVYVKNISERASFDIKIELDNNLEFNNHISWEIPILDGKTTFERLDSNGKSQINDLTPKKREDKLYIRLSYSSLPKSILNEIGLKFSGTHKHLFELDAIESKVKDNYFGFDWKNLKEII